MAASDAGSAQENARLHDEIAALDEAQRERDREHEEKQALREVARTVGSTLDVEAVLEAIVAQASRLGNCGATILEFDEAAGVLQYRYAGGLDLFPAEPAQRFLDFLRTAPVPLGEGGSGRAGATRAPVQVADIHQLPPDALNREAMIASGVRSLLYLPMLFQDRLLGVFDLVRPVPGEFTPQLIELMQLLADQAAVALHNARQHHEIEERNRELAEALEQQAALAEILRITSRSPADVDGVLAAIADAAQRLCHTDMARTRLLDGDDLVNGPAAGPSDLLAALRPTGDRIPLRRDAASAEAIRTVATVQIEDMRQNAEASGMPADAVERIRRSTGQTSGLFVPLARDAAAIGVLILGRFHTARPFTDQEVALAETFASQAVIAIENARLFDEVQSRTREAEARNTDLAESLEQQTAVSEVLRLIGSRPGDLEGVMTALIARASQRVGADSGLLTRDVERREDTLIVSRYAYDPADRLQATAGRHEVALTHDARSAPARARHERRPLQVWGAPEEIEHQYPGSPSAGYPQIPQCCLYIPLLRDDAAIGGFSLYRWRPEPFTDQQIALLETFAAQAVIAIENARLFQELQTRNSELTEAVEQQTATAEVLQAISRSAFDLPAVIQTLLDSAQRLSDADRAALCRVRDGALVWTDISSSVPAEDRLLLEGWSVPLDRPEVQEMIQSRGPVRILRSADDPAPADPPRIREYIRRRGGQAQLLVPLFAGPDLLGALTVSRNGLRPFTERQIALLQIFADQALIAIENARLLDEVQSRTREIEARNTDLAESLEQQTATAEVLALISRTPADLEPVLFGIAERAGRLVGAVSGLIWLGGATETGVFGWATEERLDQIDSPPPWRRVSATRSFLPVAE